MRHTKPVNVTKAATDVFNFRVSVRVCFCLLVGYLYNNEDSPSRLASFCVLGSEQFLQGQRIKERISSFSLAL